MRKLKIFILLLAVVLLGLSVLINWQYDNIKALYYSYKYSNKDIDGLITKHYDDIDSYLSKNGEYDVRQSTEVEQQLHQDQLLTDSEFTELLTEKKEMTDIFGMDIALNESKDFVTSDGKELTKEEIADAKETVSASQNKEPDEGKTEDEDGKKNPESTNTKISESIARMYVLKSTFESQLDGIYNEAKAYYISLTPQQRKGSKSELFKSFYNRAVALERSCDSQVNTVLANLETNLKENGETLELVTKIRNAYNEEKSLKKAYYINLYKS